MEIQKHLVALEYKHINKHTMIKQITMVEDFHRTFKQEQGTDPRLLSNKETVLRHALGVEELDEYLEAAANYDMIEVLDALADQLYIIFGTICKHGLQNHIETAFDLVHANNMAKLGPDGEPILRADGKIIKPEGFKKVELKSVLKSW
jgi:predicted HAD superfamily Cof-like phosphohydrolase